jgi:hypothetical protein
MACAEVLNGHLTLNHRIEVVDGGGELLWTVRFGDVVSVEQDEAAILPPPAPA